MTTDLKLENHQYRDRLVDASDKDLADHFYKTGTIGMSDGQVNRALKFIRSSGEGSFAFPVGRRGERHRLQGCNIDDILIKPSRRPLDEVVLGELIESIRAIGLLYPPTIMIRNDVMIDDELVDGVPILVAGRHRLEAWRRLGNYTISCVVLDISDLEAEMMEISENLHRAELTALQRDEQIARWIELTKTKREATAADQVSAQSAPKVTGRPESGINAAARELGIERTDAQRAVKVASLTPEAKAVAIEAGLDNNRTALLAAAKESEPQKQVVVIAARTSVAPSNADRDAERKVRDAERYELFKIAFAKIEPLLVEIEYQGYPDDDDEHDGDPKFAYDGLSLLQFVERYKAVLGFDRSFALVGQGAASWRRVRYACDTVQQIMYEIARSELEQPPQLERVDFQPEPMFTKGALAS